MADRLRSFLIVSAALVVPALQACGGDAGEPDPSSPEGAVATAETFCGPVMARVDSFMAVAEAASPAPDDPRYGGTVTVGGGGPIGGGMMPLTGTSHTGNQHHMFVNQMSLLRYDADLQPRPYLAESWELAPDTSSITFRLRDDVMWHDGERTDAYDLAFTYGRASDPATGYPNAAFWDFYGEAEVVDSFTVRIAMEPHAEFLDAWRTFTILPEHLLGDVPIEELASHPFAQTCPVGNGPFVFVSHRPQESWTFRANPAFPEALGGRPRVDRYVYRIIPEQATLLAEVLTGGIDVYVQVRADQASRVEESTRVRLVASDSRDVVFLAWNTRRDAVADAAVRRALSRGIDREAIVSSLTHGYAEVGTTTLPPFHWAYDASAGPDVSYDPDAAGAMLDEAGWSDRDGNGVRENTEGEELVLDVITNTGNQMRVDVGQMIQAQLAEVGVRMEFQAYEMQTLMDRVFNPATRDYDGLFLSWAHEFRVDDSDLYHGDRIDHPYQFSGIQDDRLSTLVDTLRVVTDRDAATPLWQEYQARLVELQPAIGLYYPKRLVAVSNRLQGVVVDARGEWVSIRDWWLDEAGGEDR